jgi:ribose transport system ATP-binding protein
MYSLLLPVLFRLKSKGVSIVYIFHRLEEVLRITSRITIMKDGTYVNTVNTKYTSKDQLATMMVSRQLSQLFAEYRTIVIMLSAGL